MMKARVTRLRADHDPVNPNQLHTYMLHSIGYRWTRGRRGSGKKVEDGILKGFRLENPTSVYCARSLNGLPTSLV